MAGECDVDGAGDVGDGVVAGGASVEEDCAFVLEAFYFGGGEGCVP